jgi:uncharacterized membrane protein
MPKYQRYYIPFLTIYLMAVSIIPVSSNICGGNHPLQPVEEAASPFCKLLGSLIIEHHAIKNHEICFWMEKKGEDFPLPSCS